MTFFSNTILNRTLPQVSTYAVTDGSIAARVRATGKVSAIGNNQVKATGTRTIAAVKVKEGQEVNEGDVLFVMGSASSSEIETATDARDTAYFTAKRTEANAPTGSGSEITVNRAYNNWVDAQAQADAAFAVWAAAESNTELQDALTAMQEAEADYTNAQYKGDITRENAFLLYEAYIADGRSPDDPEMIQLLSEATSTTAEETYTKNAYDIASNRYYMVLGSSDTSTLKTAYETAQSKADSAYASYVSACDSAAISAISAGSTYATYQVDVEAAQYDLEKKEERLANLTGEGVDVNVYATVSGVVETVNFSSGDTVTKDDVMCVIEVPDQGYTMTATVTKDQASRLKVGDEGTVSNYYWGSTITAKITAIKSDKTDPQGKREITFEIDGDVTNGQELTVSVGSKSATYDIVVPKSAVMSDNNGNYVLVITSKSSALGNRYFAKRVDVEVLAEDDSYKAISGDLGVGDFVITNSSTKINSGDQIRLADNA